jgi:hypothetical protein
VAANPGDAHDHHPDAADRLDAANHADPANTADSAGTPWAGRHFEANDSAQDDGSAPAEVIEALRRFREEQAGEAQVVDALREARLLIPLVAHAGESGLNARGQLVDKTQELSIITVAGPDGRNVLPVFTSVESMGRWNPTARPVPASAVRVALAAANEKTDLVVVDPKSVTEFVIRRPALWAIAQSLPWTPSYQDESVLDAFADAAGREPAVKSVALAAGDPHSRLAGPELVVLLALVEGLTKPQLDAVVARMRERWVASETIALRVDSMRVQLVAAS